MGCCFGKKAEKEDGVAAAQVSLLHNNSHNTEMKSSVVVFRMKNSYQLVDVKLDSGFSEMSDRPILFLTGHNSGIAIAGPFFSIDHLQCSQKLLGSVIVGSHYQPVPESDASDDVFVEIGHDSCIAPEHLRITFQVLFDTSMGAEVTVLFESLSSGFSTLFRDKEQHTATPIKPGPHSSRLLCIFSPYPGHRERQDLGEITIGSSSFRISSKIEVTDAVYAHISTDLPSTPEMSPMNFTRTKPKSKSFASIFSTSASPTSSGSWSGTWSSPG